eukprot:TRINITY_DN234_c0_g1_i1.p1 TRINITY_DN234_c0_g1~~TRINITY_DN234_c0_g1_i1.p1  ORF type:complete len:1969 (+),score=675.63 TRINITY_DN234_c0_g1_i1:264-5909(+)
MSGKTIRLLQIVYGAPLKRLKINADRLVDDINKLEPQPKNLKDQKAQQKLLDDVKPVTDKALRLEKHLNDRAKLAESPQTKQQLQDAAGDVRKAAQDLVDGVNKSFADPDHADLRKPLDAIRDAVEKSRELADKTAPPAPKGLPDPVKGGAHSAPSSGPKSLHDEIVQAKDTARAIPEVAAKTPQNLPEVQDRLKDEVEQIRKKTHPEPEQWKNDVERPLANQIKAARDAARAPNNPAAKKALDDATSDLVKALDDVEAKRAPPGTGVGPSHPPASAGAPKAPPGKPKSEPQKARLADPQTKKKVNEKFKEIAPEIEKLISDPEKKEKFEQAKLKDNLQSVRADVKHHQPKKAAQHTKQAAAAAKDLAKALKDDAARPDITPEERGRLEDAAKDIEAVIPEFVAAARDAIKDDKNPEAVADLNDKIKKLNRAAERAIPKPPPAGKLPKEDWKKAKDDIQKAVDAVKRGDKAAAQKALDKAAEKAIERAIKPNPGKGLLDRDPAAGPSDELQKLWDKFKNAGNRGDPEELDKIIPEIEDAYRRLADVPNKAADNFNDAVDDLVDAINRGDPHPPIQALKDEFDKFVNDTQKDPSPEVRAAAARAADEMAPRMDDLIKKAQEAAKAPGDKKKAAEVEKAAQAAKQPANNFKNQIKPLNDNFEKAKEDMKKIADAARRGDKPAVKEGINKLDDKPVGRHFTPNRGPGVLPPEQPTGPSDELQKLFDKFKKAADRGDPNTMDKLIPEMEKEYKKAADRPKDAADALKNAVDDLVDAIKDGDCDPPIDELKDAFDRFVEDTQTDPSPEVREEAQKVADVLKPRLDDLIKKAQEAAKNPGDKNKAAEVVRAAPEFKKPLDQFKDVIKPLDDAFNKNKEEMKKAADAVRKGDKPAAQKVIDNIADKPFGRNFVPNKNGRGALPPSKPDEPCDELQKLWDKFKNAGNRADPEKMNKLIPEMEKQYNKMADKPKSAADKLKNAIDDIADAAKHGDSDIPVRALKDALDKFVKDATTDPSPEVRDAARRAADELRPAVADLVKAAEDAARNPKDPKKAAAVDAAVQKASKPVEQFKQAIKPLDDAFAKNKEEMKKAAAAAAKKDAPGTKQAIEKIADKPFGRTIAPVRGRDALPSDDPDVDELKDLFDQFAKDADKGNGKAMDDAIPKMDRAYQKVADKPKQAAEKLKAAVDDVVKAVKAGDPKPPVNRLKDAYDDFVRDNQKDPSPEIRDAAARAADEAFPHIADLIKKAEEAAKNPQDKKKAQEVEAAAQQAKRPIDAFKDKIKPLDNAWNKNKDDLKKAAEEVKKGNKPAAKKIIDQVADKPFGRNFTPNKGRGVLPPDPSVGPSDELKDLWNKFKKAANKGDAAAMEKMVPDLDKAVDKVDKATNATPIAVADKLEKAIDAVMAAQDKKDNIAPPLKLVKDALDELDQVAKSPDYDPDVRKAAQRAHDDFVPEFADFIKKAKDASSNPNDKQKARALENAVPKMKKPVKAFKAAVDPTQADDVLVNDKYGGDVKDALADLKDALRDNKPEQIKKALDNVKSKLADYNDNAHDAAKHVDDPGKKNYLDRKADDLDDLLKEIDDFNPTSSPIQIQDVIDSVPDIIDDIVCHLGSDAADDLVEGAARAANLTAFLDSVDDDDLDLGDLLGCATDLADLMRGMITDTTKVAESIGTSGEKLTDATKAALGLNSLLRDLEGDLSFEEAQTLSQQVSELRAEAKAPPPSSGGPPVPLSQATTFEDITAAVAFNIKQQCEQSENVSKTGSNVAIELSNLSISARSGDKQQMLLSAKAASAHIAAFSKEISALAAKIPGKTQQERQVQDHLIRCSQGLANYGTQLKILTSVKAASIEESKDTDESLSTIATDLGDLISQALTSMSITNTIILKAK